MKADITARRLELTKKMEQEEKDLFGKVEQEGQIEQKLALLL